MNNLKVKNMYSSKKHIRIFLFDLELDRMKITKLM